MAASYIFVYASLMEGQAQEGLLAGFPRRWGAVRGALYQLPIGEPVLHPDPEADWIRGEVVTLDRPGVLPVLDLLRAGQGRGIVRKKLPLTLDDGGEIKAWAYIMERVELRRRGLRKLSTRDWRRTNQRLDG